MASAVQSLKPHPELLDGHFYSVLCQQLNHLPQVLIKFLCVEMEIFAVQIHL